MYTIITSITSAYSFRFKHSKRCSYNQTDANCLKTNEMHYFLSIHITYIDKSSKRNLNDIDLN